MTRNRLNQDPLRKDPDKNLPSADTAGSPAIDAILDALGQPPSVQIRPGFAAEVARRAVAQPLPSTSPWTGWGPRIAVASGVALTLAMFAFAPHAAPSLANTRFDAEILLLAELGAIALFSTRLLSRD